MHSQVLSFELWIKSVRWLARAGSVIVIALLALFVVGEGGHSTVPIRARDLAGLALFPLGVVLGMIVAWRHELEGSFLSLGCLAAFYVVCGLMVGNFPDGWAFIVFTSPAFLFLVSGLMDKLKHARHFNDPFVRRV